MTLTGGIDRFSVQLEADGRSPHTRRPSLRHAEVALERCTRLD